MRTTPVTTFTDDDLAAKLFSVDDVRVHFSISWAVECIFASFTAHNTFAHPQRKFEGSSTAAASIEGGVLTFKGQLAPRDGVSFGMTVLPLPLDLTGTDGLQLRVKGDGQTYKLLAKSVRCNAR